MSGDGKLVVQDVDLSDEALRAQLSLDGRERQLTYRLGGIEPTNYIDALAVALLPIAMSRGLSLELPGELSPRLRGGLDAAQAILTGWWHDWARVEIHAGSRAIDSPPSQDPGVACFFTGGVDSFYSVLTELERVSAVIFVHGFDVPLREVEKRELVAGSLREAADDLGLELIEVETNVRELTQPYCRWGFQAHGAALASVAQLAAKRFREVLIPATHTYRDLYPWGSHALLDPLWSTEAVQIVHHGALTRTRKVALLAESETALRHLRCCFQKTGAGEINCGQCEKCLRTMASLQIVGALERCATLPDELPLREVKRMPVLGRGWATLMRDLLSEAENAGEEELAGALRRALWLGPARVRARDVRKAIRSKGRRTRRRMRKRLRPGGRRARRGALELAGRSDRGAEARSDSRIRPIVLPDDREAILDVLRPEGLHRIPSREMDDFDVGHWLVAERGDTVVGVAGFRLEQTSEGVIGKNLILAVRKEERRNGVGRALVDHRLRLMLDAGVTKVVSNTDRPELIAWLIRDYGFQKVGEIRKLEPFGRRDVDHWTTLEAPMVKAAAGISRGSSAEHPPLARTPKLESSHR